MQIQDHYLTCVSQQDFPVSPSLELTQEVKPRHDLSEEDASKFESLPNHIPNVVQQDDISAKGISEMGCKQDEVIAEKTLILLQKTYQNKNLLWMFYQIIPYWTSCQKRYLFPKSAPSLNTSSENMIKSDFDEQCYSATLHGTLSRNPTYPKICCQLLLPQK